MSRFVKGFCFSINAVTKFMFSRKLIGLIAFLLPICGATQTTFNVLPPAPEATAAFKFSEVPVSLYSGLPNISIPLYDIKLKQLSIPIELSYHARGVRVDEIASRTGLGWALNYGGMISRQTNDQPDDAATGYLNQGYYGRDVFNDAIEANRMYNDYIQHSIDMVPDYFLFNFCGRSGKFVLTQGSREAVQQKYSDVAIEPVEGLNGILGWKIVDDYGNTYYFGQSKDGRKAADYDLSSTNYRYSHLSGLAVLGTSGDQYVNTWHLMEIETPFNERVHFYYEDEYPLVYRRSYDRLEEGFLTSYFSKNESVEHQISSIHFNTGIIEFSRTEDREDLIGARRLNHVRLKDTDGKVVKSYEFKYDYTTSPVDENVLPYLGTAEPASSKRLFLKRIIEKGEDGEPKPPYIFQYNAQLLPNRFSSRQDGWGYYNGHANGPFLSFFTYSGHPVRREVNGSLSGAGLLEKITYPTGGSTEFHYEPNVGRVPAFMGELLFHNLNPVKTLSRHGGFLKHPTYYDSVEEFYSNRFTIESGIKGLVFYEFSTPHCAGAPDSPPPDPDLLPPYCFYQVSLYSYDTDQEVVLYPPNQTGQLALSPGNYLLKVEPMYEHDPATVENLFNLKFDWIEEKVEYPEDDPSLTFGPGKRIKKIIYKDHDDDVLVREFDYKIPSGESSGQILGLPNYHYINPIFPGVPAVYEHGCMPGSPLTRTQGNGIGYSYVTEFKGTRGQNVGKIETEFTLDRDEGAFYQFPYHIPIDNEWRRGRPLVTKYSAKSGDEYVHKRTITNFYAFTSAPTVLDQFDKTPTSFSLPLILFTPPEPPISNNEYTIKRYYIRGGVSDLLYTIDSWVEVGNTSEKKTEFSYNYARHYQSAVTRTGNSDGTFDVSIKTYASDYSDESGFLKAMQDANIKAVPIEVVTMKETPTETFVTGGTITTYNTPIPAVPDESFLLAPDTPIKASTFKFSNRNLGAIPRTTAPGIFSKSPHYRKIMKVGDVNSKGNILKVTRDGNYQVVYIWDYSDEIPIAEVQNASDSDVAYTSFESDGHGNWEYSGNTIADDAAPTGRKVYSLATGSIQKTSLKPLLTYRLLFWKSNNAVVNAVTSAGGHLSPISEMSEREGWTLCEYELSDASSIVLSGIGLIDELRLHPKNASMTTYTYDLLKGISTVTDPNGKTTYYKYDEFSRVKRIIDKDGSILKDFDYKYRH